MKIKEEDQYTRNIDVAHANECIRMPEHLLPINKMSSLEPPNVLLLHLNLMMNLPLN
jgi:hypothetical protein